MAAACNVCICMCVCTCDSCVTYFPALVAAVPANCFGKLGGINCGADGSCNYAASYAVQQDNSVTFFISARTSPNTWVGIGVSDDQMMVSDVKLYTCS